MSDDVSAFLSERRPHISTSKRIVDAAALVTKKKWSFYRYKLIPQILRSTFFLGTNGFLFISFFCVWRRFFGPYNFFNAFICGIPACMMAISIERKERRLFGEFYFATAIFLPSACSSVVALLMERKSRRGLLTVYMANLMIETGFKMLVSRGYVQPMKNGEVLLFSIVSAIYLYLFRKPGGLTGSSLSGLRFFLGSAELPPESEEIRDREKNGRKPASNAVLGFLNSATLDKLVTKLRNTPSHWLCRHSKGCAHYVIQGFSKMFGMGFMLQATIKMVGAMNKLFTQPSSVLRALVHKDNFSLGAFLGSFSAIFRGTNCLLRWLRDTDSSYHGMISGFLAGWTMLWYKSSSVAMYIASKLVETMYFKGIAAGWCPHIPSADVVIYSICTAFIFHVTVFEPQNLRSAYWKFLANMTNDRFSGINRHLLDVFGTNASKNYKDFWPNYDPRYTNLAR